MNETRSLFEMGLREYARTPVLLALLVFLPVYVVGLFTRAVPARTVVVEVPGAGLTEVGMKTVTAVLMTPMTAALVGGVAGLFLMRSAASVDGRLAVVGVPARSILLARAGVLTVAATLASVVAVGVTLFVHVPEQPGWFLLATVLVGLLYGGIGALVGLVFSRLAGVYVVAFAPLVDLFLAQSPLSERTPAVAEFLPGHYPTRLALDAALTAGVDPTNLLWTVAYLLVVGLASGLALRRQLHAG